MDWDLIGIEHELVMMIKKDRRQRRDGVQDVVYDIQREHRQGLWEDDDNEMLDEIQESCLHYSQCSDLFTQLLALARRQQEQ